MEKEYLVVGGGIAGVSCAGELSRLCPSSAVHLISASPLIKAVTNFTKLSHVLEKFDVSEQPLSCMTKLCPNVTVHHAKLISIDVTYRTAKLSGGSVLKYDRICLCTGAKPSLIQQHCPHVVGVRDVESVQDLQEKLGHARRVVVVGNGGIATELVYDVGGCEVVWAIKDHSIGHAYFDEGAAVFFLPHLVSQATDQVEEAGPAGGGVAEISPFKRHRYTVVKSAESATTEEAGTGKETVGGANVGGATTMGGALGPDWHSDLKMTGKAFDEKSRHVHVEYKCEVKEILTHDEFKVRGITPTPFPSKTTDDTTSCHETGSGDIASCDDWPVYVVLTNGVVFGCDLVVSATGVTPSTGELVMEGEGCVALVLAEDGGVAVDKEMRTNLSCVYAAGDVCCTQWEDHSNLWFQMRLWTQARQMGAYAAQCMDAHSRGEGMMLDFCFELFSHVTTFFGYKVVLLGLFNGQTLGQDHEIHLRCTKGVEYVKVVVKEGRVVGALLIGETDLEETFENLILNQMDISQFDLLDPRVDLEDFFD